MRETILIVCCTCVFWAGCTASPNRNNAGISTSRDEGPTKISFGFYDISKSGPSLSDLFKPREPLMQKGISASQPVVSEPANQNAETIDRATVRSTNIAEEEPATTRKVIKNAEMHLEASDPDTLQKVIAGIAESNSGFVLSTEQSMSDVSTGVRDSISITIRVPATRFSVALDSIRQSAERFLVESMKGEDVTEEFVDVQARLRAKRALEEQFMAILKEAETVEDALSVQSHLASVRTDIEKIEGRLRYLENQSEFSTIRIHIQTPASVAATSAGFFARLGESVAIGADGATNFTLHLVTFVIGAMPFAIFIGLPIFLVGRSFWSRKTNTMSVTEIAQYENTTE
jgi:hypothetical protein